MLNLIRLNKTQIKPAADVLARAFQDDPLFIFFFPKAAERENKLPHLFKFLVRYAAFYGEVYATSPNLEGVTVWLPSEKADMSPWQMLRPSGLTMPLKMGMGNMVRMMCYTEYATATHKRQARFKHWYLQFIGVAPLFQGKGYASALLNPMFARLDIEQLPCYLETFTQKNRYGS